MAVIFSVSGYQSTGHQYLYLEHVCMKYVRQRLRNMKIATIGIVPREANERGRDRFYSSKYSTAVFTL